MSATFTATIVAWLTGQLENITDLLFGASYVDGPLGGIASVLAVALATVFAFAAYTKISNPEQTASEFSNLLVPAPTLLARLVPLAELLVAIALVIWPRLGAMFAATLLGAFTTLLVVTVRSGRIVSCGCLGAKSSEPVTMATVARNFVLLAMALAALTVPTLTMPSLASLLVMGSSIVLIAMVVQLVALRQTLGRIWSVQLAGEAAGVVGSTNTDVLQSTHAQQTKRSLKSKLRETKGMTA